jgi:hypothetical protein
MIVRRCCSEGWDVVRFAYPEGAYDQTAKQIVRDEGVTGFVELR